MKYEELVGKYLNGFFITKVENDPFVKGQIDLWTDSTKGDFLGNIEVVKFYVRDYPSGASIYQEQVDKEIERLNNIINELEKHVENSLKLADENETEDTVSYVRDILNKLQELKGDSGND